ncbi:MAG: LCP family protein [Kineosporiaceae bacterium]
MTQVAPHSSRNDRDGAGLGESSPGGSPFPTEPPASGRRLRGRHATSYGQGFSRVVGWTILGSVVPGLGLIAAGRRTVGRILLTLTILLVGALFAFVLLGDTTSFVLHFATSTNDLLMLAVGVLALTVLWALVVLSTHVSLRRFASLTRVQGLLSTALVTAIIAAGGLVAVRTASYSLIGRDTLKAITSSGVQIEGAPRPKNDQPDPWADVPRVNVLLIGSDAGADRTGVRTDTILVASVDTHDGDTVIFGLPRNLQHVPFPSGTPMRAMYPDGYACADQSCLLNALWSFGVENADNPQSQAYSYYHRFQNPGLQATIDGVEGATGLTINDYALLDLAGFEDFINAIGGLVVNVQRPIPVAGSEDPLTGRQIGVKRYIQPGRQRLNGYLTMWYARSRSDSSDYDRMQRQRCVLGALSQQTNPITLAQAFPQLAKSIQKDMSTSIPLDDLGSWVTLALRIKSAHIRSLPFTDAVINTAAPDFAKIHRLVDDAIQPPQATPSSTGSSTAKPSAKPSATKPSNGTTSAPADPTKAVDVNQVC